MLNQTLATSVLFHGWQALKSMCRKVLRCPAEAGLGSNCPFYPAANVPVDFHSPLLGAPFVLAPKREEEVALFGSGTSEIETAGRLKVAGGNIFECWLVYH